MRCLDRIALLGLSVLTLVGCGGGEVEASESAPASSDRASTAPEPAIAPEPEPEPIATWGTDPLVLSMSEPFTGDLPAMREREVVRVLVSYSRTNFFISEGQLRGFEVEMFRELEKELAEQEPKGSPPLRFVFLPVAFDQLLPALLEGRGDVAAASLTATPERQRTITFTSPFLTGVEEILVAHVGAPPVTRWEDLAGAEIHVAAGTSFEDDLLLMNQQLVERGLDPLRVVPGGRGLKTEDMLELVHTGAFEYTVCDRFVAELWSEVLDGLRLESDVVLRTGGEIAWAVRPDSVELKALLDGFATRNRKGTLIGNILFRRYFEATKWISNPLLDEERGKLAKFRAAIERHAADFGFDWRLIAAQAYQESGLDPQTVSGAGAVGLMQLLPSTAKDMGVTDLRDPERNVYAGVKYMDWLRRNYFDEEQLTADDQVDFCLAAYNAGPGRVRRWRAAAPARGLDPDKWFGNVELLALEDVGMQPVQYVGNINKYFVLYALTLEGLEARDRARSELDKR